MSFSDFEESNAEESSKETDFELEEEENLEPEEAYIDDEVQDQPVDDYKSKGQELSDSEFPKHSEFTHLLYDDVNVISVNIPRATLDIAAKFKDYLKLIIEAGRSKIVIDLSECEFVDSTVLGVLVSSLKQAMSKNGDVRIVWGDNTESSMFYITRMDKVFKLFDTLELAINSYTSN